MSSGRAGDECSFRELFKAAQETCASHASCSFDKKLTPPATAELSVFDETGRSLSSQHASDPPWRKITDGATVARFVLGGSRPPRLTDALILAERVHAALVELSDGSAVFTGCDEKKRPLVGHAHAYILPESNLALGQGKAGEITHLTVYAPAGLGPREIGALEGLREVGGSGLDLQLTLSGLGQPGDFGGTDASRGESPLLAESRIWISRTPFIPTRHPKATRAGVPKLDPRGLQIGSPEHELRGLLGLAGFPEPAAVERVSFTEIAGERVEWASFRTARSAGYGRRAGSTGYGFRIEFPDLVRGPVALGYGAHFGMGGFVGDRIE